VRPGRSGARLSAVFLDRDGVVNRKAPEGSYVTSVDEFELLPGVPEAVARLRDAGLKVVVVTNQRGIARGALTLDDLAAIHARLPPVDGVYFCPHEGDCACRKPGTAMFEWAARDHGFALDASAVVGDRASDMVAADRIGALRVHVRGVVEPLPELDHEAADLPAAVDWLLS
jgi:histidinol-phosphate phosphatase family protein